MRNRFENQSRTIKRRERSKTGVKNTEEEEEEKEWKEGGEEPRFVGVERRRGRERSRRAASRKSGREKKRMKIAVVKSTRVAPNAINR